MNRCVSRLLTFYLALIAAVLFTGCASAPEPKPAPADETAAKTEEGKAEQETAEKKIEKPKPYDAVPIIPRETIFGNPTKVGPELSPDGKHLAWLAPDEGVLNVWVRTVGKQDDRAVTKDRKRGIRFFTWAENSKQLIYIQDKGGDENWHLWVAPLKGGEPKDMTPIEGVRVHYFGSDPSRPNELVIGLNDRDKRMHDAYLLNLKTGKKKLLVKNTMGALGFTIDHKLRVRLATLPTPDGGTKVMHRAKPKQKWKQLLEFSGPDAMTSGTLFFAADNRTLYIQSSVGSNTSELRSINTRNKKEKVLFKDPEADVGSLLVHPTKHTIQAVEITKARSEWKVLDDKVAGDFEKLKEVAHGDFQVISHDRADKTWLVAYVQDKGPVAYYSWDRGAKKATFMFVHRPELKDVELAEMKPVSYKSGDGLTINAYLSLPPKVEAKNLPAVVLPHGGPWHRDSWGYDGMAQWLANRGYAVLQPNFRGSTGYGKDFLNAGDREWGGKMQDDITDGTKWLIEQKIADPERICIMGGSYGGYATLMGLVREPDLYVCGVDIVGVANLITWLKTIPPYWKPFEPILHKRVGHPEKDADFLKKHSPVFMADKIADPLLIAQGKNDPRVPRDESIQIRDALKDRDLEVKYVEYPDEGHGFARPENRLDFYARAEEFLARHLGGRFEPLPEKKAPDTGTDTGTEVEKKPEKTGTE